jgi:hypothetical protein
MKRYAIRGVLITAALAAGSLGVGCGDDDGGTEVDGGALPKCDEVGGAPCFELPEAATLKDTGAAANWACPADTVETSTIAVTVSGTVEDFQSGDPIDTPTVEAFQGLDFNAPVGMATGDVNGLFSVALDVGEAKSRMNWRMTADGQLPTYALNEEMDITMAMLTGFNRGSVSIATANALPAFIGVIRTEGLGVLAGAAVDCDRDSVENVIATVSSTSSVGNVAPTFVAGAQVYYFSNGDPDLPVRRTSRTVSNKDGLFVIIELTPTTGTDTVFLQTWGFKTAADVAMGMAGLTLLSELESPVFGESVISVEMAPTEGQ